MRWFCGGGLHSDALVWELRQAGQEVDEGPNWYAYYDDGTSTPHDWGKATRQFMESRGGYYDVFLVSKGAYFRDGKLWRLDDLTLWGIKRRVGCMIYLCYDDPAFSPITLASRMLQVFDAWGTTCPGVLCLLSQYRKLAPKRIFRHWLAWDRRISLPVPKQDGLAVDLAMTGTPYYRPFPEPHYQWGLGCARAMLIREALSRGHSVGLWGTEQWLDETRGGGPDFQSHWRGRVPIEQIHHVHASAKVCLGTHLVEGPEYESGRIPWVGGAGGCLIHEDRPGLRHEFGDMVEWFAPGDVKEFGEKLSNLLAQPDRMANMSSRLQAHIIAKHTWKNRAEELIEVAHSLQHS